MRIRTTVYSRGEQYAANIILDDGELIDEKPSLFWFGDCDEDKDGSPDWSHDPSGQSDTSLHYKGKPLNGNVIPFIVVPPDVINAVPGIVMGCMGLMQWNGRTVECVVGDIGPRSKIGEASSAALAGIGAPITRNGNGGVDQQEVFFRIWPGVPAILIIDGVTYEFDLHPS